ncbi:protein phosphatase 2C 70 isoform X2 [Hevea brasiliensis]|uniref:protein phosphatase 2C 70 isoform X2 n=1 Tax=Hevea brasiliensis TaxID=3981 RepID=UPI000B77D9CD|nr:protein phosphatase 2C 70 isoform X2 [Hevea brasiliensis]
MEMMLLEIIVGVLVLMLLLILLLIFLACKPWRFFFSSRSPTLKVGDLDRPLVSDDVESNELARNYDLEGACYQNEGPLHLSRPVGLVHKQRLPSTSAHLIQDVVSEPAEEISVDQTFKCIFPAEHLAEVQRHVRQEDQSHILGLSQENDPFQEFVPKVIIDQRSCLSLEVISGPSSGVRCSVQSTSSSRLPLTLGRVSSDLLLKDSEVSGKHAMINWNMDKKKWELVDMGSLNGTLLNSQPVNHPDSGSRHWGDPVELTNGDIITLGTTSNVHVTSKSENETPFGVGMASDPMALRRGGKKLAMEDVCYYQWPLPGIDQFGVFGICDGHGGVAAANSASKMLPEKVANILSDSLTRERVLSQCDASEVLRVAFSQTEASMNNYYEGCTATVLLVWANGDENFFAQCANLGDSACVMNVDGKQIKMTEDHRVTSYSERLRISEIGEPLKDGETRLCGLNLARMLGDKFLKQQDARFSSEPYISEAVHINQASGAFALLASDGFWDVISVKKAVQLVLQNLELLSTQTRERYSTDGENPAEKIANFLLSEARTLRTKDNTSIIFLDFDSKSRLSSCEPVS